MVKDSITVDLSNTDITALEFQGTLGITYHGDDVRYWEANQLHRFLLDHEVLATHEESE